MENKKYTKGRQVSLHITNKQGLRGRRSKDLSQLPRDALALENVLCSPSLMSQWRTAEVKSHVHKVNLKAQKHVAAQIWCLWTPSGTLKVVPRLSRRFFTSLSTLIIRGTIVLAFLYTKSVKTKLPRLISALVFRLITKSSKKFWLKTSKNHYFRSSLQRHICYWRICTPTVSFQFPT